MKKIYIVGVQIGNIKLKNKIKNSHKSYGQLGIDSTENFKYYPTKVTKLTNVVSISLGGYFTCAITIDKNLFCWGSNEYYFFF
jgi:alpha-tubulin suppressor-like RCC1 family protein